MASKPESTAFTRLNQINIRSLVTNEAYKSFDQAMNLNDVSIDRTAQKLGLTSFDFSPDVFLLFDWTDRYDERISLHQLRTKYFAERTVDVLEWADTPKGTALVYGSLLHDTGKLSFTKEMLGDDGYKFNLEEEKIKRLHPTVGAYLFWKAVQTVPPHIKEYDDENKKLKHDWFTTKDMISAMILYHHPDYGSREDEINGKPLKTLMNVPRLKDHVFREVAVIASFIDTAVAVLENRNGGGNGHVKEEIRKRLLQRIKQFEKRFKKERIKVKKEEIQYYESLISEIAEHYPYLWRVAEFEI